MLRVGIAGADFGGEDIDVLGRGAGGADEIALDDYVLAVEGTDAERLERSRQGALDGRGINAGDGYIDIVAGDAEGTAELDVLGYGRLVGSCAGGDILGRGIGIAAAGRYDCEGRLREFGDAAVNALGGFDFDFVADVCARDGLSLLVVDIDCAALVGHDESVVGLAGHESFIDGHFGALGSSYGLGHGAGDALDGSAFGEALHGRIHHFVLRLGGVELIGAGDYGSAAVLDFGSPLVILAVLESVHDDGCSVVGQVELHIVLAGVGGAGLETGDLARETVVRIGISLGDEFRDGAGSDFGLVGSLLPDLAVEAVEVCFVLDGLGGVALVVDHLAVDNHFVAFLDVGACSGSVFLVAEVEDTIAVELVLGIAVIGNVERGVAVSAGCGVGLVGLGDIGDYSLDIDLRGAVDVGAEALDVLDGAGDGIRVFEGTGALLELAGGAFLDHLESYFAKVDGEDHVSLTVKAGIGIHGHGHGLGLGGSRSAADAQCKPVGLAGDIPVAGGGQFHGLGTFGLVERKLGGVYRDSGGAELFLLLAGGEDRREGKNRSNKTL